MQGLAGFPEPNTDFQLTAHLLALFLGAGGLVGTPWLCYKHDDDLFQNLVFLGWRFLVFTWRCVARQVISGYLKLVARV
jgi:hypothetical protein